MRSVRAGVWLRCATNARDICGVLVLRRIGSHVACSVFKDVAIFLGGDDLLLHRSCGRRLNSHAGMEWNGEDRGWLD
jgi:hypothetical protein